MKLFDWANQHL